MSAHPVFDALFRRIAATGATNVRFVVDLERFLNGPEPGVGKDHSWQCYANANKIATGRTGEEALRNLAEALDP